VNNAQAHTSIGIIEAAWKKVKKQPEEKQTSRWPGERTALGARAPTYSLFTELHQFNQNNRAKLMAALRFDKLPARRLHFHTCIVGDWRLQIFPTN
jgi:hypothetical protein